MTCDNSGQHYLQNDILPIRFVAKYDNICRMKIYTFSCYFAYLWIHWAPS